MLDRPLRAPTEQVRMRCAWGDRVRHGTERGRPKRDNKVTYPPKHIFKTNERDHSKIQHIHYYLTSSAICYCRSVLERLARTLLGVRTYRLNAADSHLPNILIVESSIPAAAAAACRSRPNTEAMPAVFSVVQPHR